MAISSLLYSEGSTFKNNCVKSNKHRPILSAANCRSTTLVSGNINIVFRYSKAFLGELSSYQSGVVEIDEMTGFLLL